jgi:hypothetical protein
MSEPAEYRLLASERQIREAERMIREDVANAADETGTEPDRFLLGIADWLKGVAKFSQNPRLLTPTSREWVVANFVAESYLDQVEALRQP